MKNLKRIDEAVGSILERRAAADVLLKDVVKGNTSEVEGIKLSKEMAEAFLDWQKMSTYGKKFGKLPFYMLFMAAFNWGLERYIGKDKNIKAEYKELKAKAKVMSKEQRMKAESLDEKRSSPFGEIMLDIDAASKQVKLPMKWMKDYVKSIERMAKRSAKKFFKDYGTFSVDDWAEDMEYNFANESKVNEAVKPIKLSGNLKKDLKAVTAMATEMVDYAKDNFNTYIPTGEKLSQLKLGGTREKDVLEYNIRHLAKAINTDLKKKYMKDFVAESVNEEEKDFEPHMMYDPKTGKGYKADTYADHVRMDKMGYVHDKPEIADDMIELDEAKFSFSEDQVKDVAELIAKAIAKMDKSKTAVHDMEYDAGRGAGFEISMDGEKYDGGSYVVRPNGEVYNAAIGNSFPNAVYAKIGDTDIRKVMKNIKKFESVEVNEARFVKSYDTKVNDAETEKEVLKIYPKAKFFVGKLTHFFGELEPNLFFKAYYPKYYKQDTGKSVKGDFKITSVYSKKGSNYVELMKESVEVNEAAPRMKKSKEVEELEKLKSLVVNARKGGMGNRYGKEFDRAKNKAVVALDNMISYAKIGV